MGWLKVDLPCASAKAEMLPAWTLWADRAVCAAGLQLPVLLMLMLMLMLPTGMMLLTMMMRVFMVMMMMMMMSVTNRVVHLHQQRLQLQTSWVLLWLRAGRHTLTPSIGKCERSGFVWMSIHLHGNKVCCCGWLPERFVPQALDTAAQFLLAISHAMPSNGS